MKIDHMSFLNTKIYWAGEILQKRPLFHLHRNWSGFQHPNVVDNHL